MKKKVHSISWWLVGPEYWAAVLYDKNNNVIGDWPKTGATKLTATANEKTAFDVALPAVSALAIKHGVSPENVVYDADDTESYREYFKGKEDK